MEPEINVFFVVGNHDFHLIQFPESYFGVKFDLKYDLSLDYGGTTYRLYMDTSLKINDLVRWKYTGIHTSHLLGWKR